jgi:intraflagellar transport protein 140
LFVENNLEVYKQLLKQIERESILCAFDIHHYYIQSMTTLRTEILDQFVGLDLTSQQKKQLIELNYYQATGDVESALSIVRKSDNVEMWKTFAQTCARMKRLDLIKMCFGKMGDAASSIFIHKQIQNGISDADLTPFVELQLNFLDSAKKSAKDLKRFSTLARIYEIVTKWEESINISALHDHLDPKARFYKQGQFFEAVGKYSQAIDAYEKQELLRTNYPDLHSKPTLFHLFSKEQEDIPLKHRQISGFATFLKHMENMMKRLIII